MIYGYVRISTNTGKQKIDRQVYELLDKVPDLEPHNIYKDEKTGTNMNRQGLIELKKILRPGDVVYVTELSRLSRSTQDLLEQIAEFSEKEVEFHSLKEAFDFNSTFGKLILTVLAAVATLERDLIVDRINEGLRVAKAKGHKLGRPRINEKIIADAMKLHDSGDYTIPRILAMTGISRSTFYRALGRKKALEVLNDEQAREINKQEK